ncbi:Hypothetical protein CINCED_3A017886 [Cinara cedri]|uniref:Uncharacterized protein n=1 Tax=Cinara cedri TaxID=506608 RepID=A0A5E4M7B5_9HEMI|nr:Hypothetical protein CINCED_3A017886 [Cinara cedri]
MDNLRKFVIVDFSNGLQVVYKNLQINHHHFYYPNANWTSYIINKIYGYDDKLKNSISKLHQVKNYSDIDEDSPKYRHKYCFKRLSYDDNGFSPPMFHSENDLLLNMKNKIIDEFPKTPNSFTLKQSLSGLFELYANKGSKSNRIDITGFSDF